ncbi:MAG: DNA polymerase [Rhodobiaceae bacterium]|jgi:hypothetical protein|nr:DNA polymerase [Rhodobiaceae bacterium]|tara:strand:- start:2326 stop:2991 length:666 start_codon:yes stop_codon:yes gene_type:complete
MKISKETLSVLKNFATINGNILIKAGDRLSTISAQKNVMASTSVKESFDREFGIYDLNEFLGVYSLFDADPELNFDEKFVTVANGKSKVKYYAADPSVLASPTKDALPVDEDIKFDLPRSMYDMIMKTSSVLRSNDISIIGSDGKLSVVVADKKNATSNSWDAILGDTDKDFKVNFRIDNFKMLDGDYEVTISKKRISKFASKMNDLTYFIAVEADSTFDF